MLLDELGLASAIFPELAPMKELPQGLPSAPTGYLWDHVLRVLGRLGADASFPLALAALLHDIGKPRVVGRTPDRYTFHSHEHVGKRLAGEICARLKLSNAERERVEWLVEKHQFLCDARHMRTSKLKMMLAHPGIRELLALHRADALASGRSTDHVDYCEQLLSEWTEADLNPPPLLTGHDLMRLGLAPGPAYKPILDSVREAQLEGTIKTQKQALELAEKLVDEEKRTEAQGQGSGEA
jgi:poly(A) polymerase